MASDLEQLKQDVAYIKSLLQGYGIVSSVPEEPASDSPPDPSPSPNP